MLLLWSLQTLGESFRVSVCKLSQKNDLNDLFLMFWTQTTVCWSTNSFCRLLWSWKDKHSHCISHIHVWHIYLHSRISTWCISRSGTHLVLNACFLCPQGNERVFYQKCYMNCSRFSELVGHGQQGWAETRYLSCMEVIPQNLEVANTCICV